MILKPNKIKLNSFGAHGAIRVRFLLDGLYKIATYIIIKKDLLGNVIEILDITGATVVKYTYDA